jgi:phosphonate degradation associated HDIG domain protein
MRMPSDILERIEHWFALHGASSYEGHRRESVSALNHALQCAQLAEDARADPALVVAALLHDVGHFVAIDDIGERADIDDVHELRGVAVLVRDFPPAVIEPIRLHVAAKRYLTAIEPKYAAGLSPASVHSLVQQGGPMKAVEIARFEALRFADDAVRLRRWDDLAKMAGQQTPPLAYYLALVDEVRLCAKPIARH